MQYIIHAPVAVFGVDESGVLSSPPVSYEYVKAGTCPVQRRRKEEMEKMGMKSLV